MRGEMNAIAEPGSAAPVLDAVKTTLVGALERQDFLRPAVELRVQRAVDLLRTDRSDAAALAQMELLSCLIRKVHVAMLGGRINAYESGLLRLRRTVERL